MKIDSDASASEKRRWKLVRADDYRDIPGTVVSADTDTGEFVVMEPTFDDKGYRVVDSSGAGQFAPKQYSWSPGSFRIARAK